MSTVNVIKLILSVVIPLAVGAIAGTATAKEIPGWYAGLVRPGIAPPDWVFGPVWATLNILIWRLKPIAARINLPCLLWVSFATLLTWSYWRLN